MTSKEVIRYIPKYLFLSALVIIVIPVCAYFLDQRWVIWVFVPLFLVFVWALAIMNYDSPIDIKAYKEAINMTKKKKELFQQVQTPLPPFPLTTAINNDEIKDSTPSPNRSLQEPAQNLSESILPITTAPAGPIDDVTRIVGLKKEMLAVDNEIGKLEMQKQVLQSNIEQLHMVRKELKEKIFELIG
jgi:hypothetical protein